MYDMSSFFPFSPLNPFDDDDNTKLNHDRYEVYVNGDFLGYKVLFGHHEEISDIDDFISDHGIKQFHTRLDGDHYVIETEEDKGLKDILSVYLESH